MNIWPRTRVINSSQNGAIKVSRWLGRPRVFVDGYDQSTPYIQTMWRRALKQLPSTPVSSVLMLGLGTGSALPELHKRFPKARVTVIEWDPVMIKLFKESEPSFPVDILAGDAAKLVPKLETKFDLILVDLYHGQHPAEVLSRSSMLDSIAGVLSSDGYCIVNAFGDQELLDRFENHLTRLKSWRFRYNHLALYHHQ